MSRMRMGWLVGWVWVGWVPCALAEAPAPRPSVGIEVWTRGHEDARVKVEPRTLRQQSRELADPQYRQVYLFRGVPLGELFVAAPAQTGAGVDVALLHFQNGMRVPVHFLDAAELARIDVFVATAFAKPTADKRPEWSSEFPQLAKAGAKEEDRRPLRFDGNKLVVRSLWHPALASSAKGSFSPWLYVDALVGIEYAREAEDDAAFASESERKGPGYAVFKSRCQFCHGARGQGAQYGWDFVEPVPLYKHRSPKSLELHVRYRELDAPKKGLMMPAFPELEPGQLEALWKWMEALATRE